MNAVKIIALAAVLVPMIGIGEDPWVPSLGVSAAQADVSVYRGLQRNKNRANTSNGQFRIDKDGLSTFEAAEFPPHATRHRCKLEFIITGVTSKPDEGTQGYIDSMDGYEGTYSPDPSGEGHWSIANSDGIANTLPADFTAYARDNRDKITINAGYTGTGISQCN